MAIRSMTGYARVAGKVEGGRAFTLSLKSVNHRFLDLQFRLPSESDGLEMKLRRVLKGQMTRGHVDVTVSLDRVGEDGAAVELAVNKEIVGGYVQAFRTAAKEFGLTGDPDLNAILRVPGAIDATAPKVGDALDEAVLGCLPEALDRLNAMREEEGSATARELRDRMERLRKAVAEVGKYRALVQKAYVDRLQARMTELIGAQADPTRVLQEVALLADRSDIQEELVRLQNHVDHFLGLLDAGGEAGKQLDFLLQEMNREANTMLSKTSGLAGEAMKITEIGLVVKSEIEKSKEQVQNLESTIVYIISAPSGSGKSTLVNEVRRLVPRLDFSVSYTTRAPRGSEQSGREYSFVSRADFIGMVRKGEFLEHAEFDGNFYGTSRRFLREANQKGHDLVLDIDVQGAKQIRQQGLPDAVSIFILPPDRKTLEWRLRNRSEDSDDVIQRRLVTARREIANFGDYDYILVNDRLEQAADELKAVVQAERLLRAGRELTQEEKRLAGMAERCRLVNMRERAQGIVDTFLDRTG